jgi:NAD(P)-dependent dehydrogenase (short-subunit alcohol dehydrogenase family)
MFRLSSLPPLNEKVFLVTGGNTGIGYITCLQLAGKGARVYLGARSEEKATEAIINIKEKYPDADLHFLSIDHKSLKTVVAAAKTFVSKESQLHGLILNAGVSNLPYEITMDGFEIQMQVNYLAHWLLAYHLTPILLSTARQAVPGSVRVVCVASDANNRFGTKKILYGVDEVKNAGNYKRYGLSKLANVLHAKNLNDAYGPESQNAKDGKGEIWTASLHPGLYNTQMNLNTRDTTHWLLRWIYSLVLLLGIMKPVGEDAVRASLFAGASPDFTANMSGEFLGETAEVIEPKPISRDVKELQRLEEWTEKNMKAGGWI